MDLTVLAVPDYPNVMLLEERLAQVLEGRRDVTVSRQVIADQDEAARRGMPGSPTILVDGIDPFAEPGQPASPGRPPQPAGPLRGKPGTGPRSRRT